MLRRFYDGLGVDFGKLNDKIRDIIIKTLISADAGIQSEISKNQTVRSSCFSLYSFDFVVDEDIRPWLVNVNTSPSLNSVSPIDKRIKTMLVCDAMTLIGIRPYHKAKVHAQSRD